VIAVEDRSKLPVLMEQYHPRALVVNATDSSDAEDVADLAGGALPIVTCSLVAERALGEELGVASYLVKPVLQEQLAEALVRFDGRVRRVLIVDNDMQMVRLLTSLLEMVAPNYTVSRAYGGAEGLSEMRRDPPDLVLLDLVMPEVDGYEVLSRMRADAGLRDIPVIAVTGQTRTPEEERRLGQNTVSLRVPDGLTNQETLDYVAGLLDAVPL
jgi:CheY-like chemotaxis protein